MSFKRLCLTIVVAGSMLSVGFSGERRPLTVDDYLRLPVASSPVISPDGKRVAFVVRGADLDRNRFVRTIWVVGTDGRDLGRVTFSVGNDYHPRWSPDGRFLAFLSTRPYYTKGQRKENRAQIWLLPAAGGEARRVSDATAGVTDFVWSPDGKAIYYISRKPLPEEERRKREERAKGFDAVVVGEPNRPFELWVLDLRENRGRRIAELDAGVSGLDVDPTGKWLVYATNYTGEYNDEQKYDLWLVELETGEKRQLTDFPGPETSPAFSPDGKQIVYVAQTVPDIEFAETDLWVIPVESGRPTCLTHRFGYAARRPVWDPRGGWIYFSAAIRTSNHLLKVRVRDKRIAPVAVGDACFSQYSVASKSGALAAVREDAFSLPEVVVIDPGGGEPRAVTHFSADLVQFRLGRQTVIRWRNEGFEIEGILVLPVDYQEGTKVPLILTVHGGPYSRFCNTFQQSYMWQVYANRGFAVLGPNPRGSSGYSDRFGQANRYDLGGGDYRDIMAGVDHVIALGVADSNRMGVIGGSYGGYMTNWIITHTNRFKAAVSMYGIFSLFTDWSNSIQPAWEKMYFGVYYWEDLKPYLEHSPAFYVQNVETPVLILHGKEDELTFIANSKEMWQALRVLGKPVEFVVYPREGHGISREPNHIRDRMRRTLEWFERYLKN